MALLSHFHDVCGLQHGSSHLRRAAPEASNSLIGEGGRGNTEGDGKDKGPETFGSDLMPEEHGPSAGIAVPPTCSTQGVLDRGRHVETSTTLPPPPPPSLLVVTSGVGASGCDADARYTDGSGEEGYLWKRKSTIRVKKGRRNADPAEGSASPGHCCVDTNIPALTGVSPEHDTVIPIATNPQATLVFDTSHSEQIEPANEATQHTSVCSGIEKDMYVDTKTLDEQQTTIPSEGILDRAPSDVPSVEKDNVEGKLDVMAPTRASSEGATCGAGGDKEEAAPETMHPVAGKTSADLNGSMEEGRGRCDQEQAEVPNTLTRTGEIQSDIQLEKAVFSTQHVITPTLDSQEHQTGDLEAAASNELYDWRRKRGKYVKKSGRKKTNAGEEAVEKHHSPPQDVSSLPHVPSHPLTEATPTALTEATPKAPTEFITILPMSAHPTLVLDTSHSEQMVPIEEANEHTSGLEHVDTQPLGEQQTTIPSEGILDRTPSEVPSVEKDNVEGKLGVMAPTGGDKEGTVVEADSERPTEKEEPHLQGGSTPHLTEAVHSAEVKTSTDVTHLAGSMGGGRCDQEQPEVSVASNVARDIAPNIQPPKHEEKVLPTIEPTQQVITPPSDTLDPQEHQTGDLEASVSNELYDWRRKRGKYVKKSGRKKTNAGEEAVEKHHSPPQDVSSLPHAPLHQEALITTAHTEATPTAHTEATPTAHTETTPAAHTEATPTAHTEAILIASAHVTSILDTPISVHIEQPVEGANKQSAVFGGLEYIDTQPLNEQPSSVPSEGILVRTPSEVPSVEKDNVEGKLDVMAPTAGDKEGTVIDVSPTEAHLQVEGSALQFSDPAGTKTRADTKESLQAVGCDQGQPYMSVSSDVANDIPSNIQPPKHEEEVLLIIEPTQQVITPPLDTLDPQEHQTGDLEDTASNELYDWRRKRGKYVKKSGRKKTNAGEEAILQFPRQHTTPPQDIDSPSLPVTNDFMVKLVDKNASIGVEMVTSSNVLQTKHTYFEDKMLPIEVDKAQSTVGGGTTPSSLQQGSPPDHNIPLPTSLYPLATDTSLMMQTEPTEETNKKTSELGGLWKECVDTKLIDSWQPTSIPSEGIVLSVIPSEVPSVEKDNVEGKLDVMSPTGGDKEGTVVEAERERPTEMEEPHLQGRSTPHLTEAIHSTEAKASTHLVGSMGGRKSDQEQPEVLIPSSVPGLAPPYIQPSKLDEEVLPTIEPTQQVITSPPDTLDPQEHQTGDLEASASNELYDWRRKRGKYVKKSQRKKTNAGEEAVEKHHSPPQDVSSLPHVPSHQDALIRDQTEIIRFTLAEATPTAPTEAMPPHPALALDTPLSEPVDIDTQPLNEQPTSVPSEGILDRAPSEVPSVEKDNVEGKLGVMAPTGGDKEVTVVDVSADKEEPHLQGGSTPHLLDAIHSAEVKTSTDVTYLAGSVGGGRCDQGQPEVSIPSSVPGLAPPNIQPPKHEEEVLPTIEPTQQIITPPSDTPDPQEHQTGDLEASASNELYDWRRKKSQRKKTNAGEEAVEKHHSPPQDVSSLPHAPLHQEALITTAHTEATPAAHTEATPTAHIEATPTAHTEAVLIASAHVTSILDTPISVHIEQPVEGANKQSAVFGGLEYIDTQPLNEQPSSVPSEGILDRAPSEVPSVEKDNVEEKLDVMAPTAGDKEGTFVGVSPTEAHLQVEGSALQFSDPAGTKTRVDTKESLQAVGCDQGQPYMSVSSNVANDIPPDIQPPKHEEEVLPTIEPTQQVITPPLDTLDPQEHQTGDLEASVSNELYDWRRKRGKYVKKSGRKKTNAGEEAVEKRHSPPENTLAASLPQFTAQQIVGSMACVQGAVNEIPVVYNCVDKQTVVNNSDYVVGESDAVKLSAEIIQLDHTISKGKVRDMALATEDLNFDLGKGRVIPICESRQPDVGKRPVVSDYVVEEIETNNTSGVNVMTSAELSHLEHTCVKSTVGYIVPTPENKEGTVRHRVADGSTFGKGEKSECASAVTSDLVQLTLVAEYTMSSLVSEVASEKNRPSEDKSTWSAWPYPTVNAEPTPIALAEATPIALAEATPIALAEATPIALAEATPITLDATPIAVAEATPITLTEATPIAVAEATPITLADATPIALAVATPIALAEATPIALAEATPVALAKIITEAIPTSPKELHHIVSFMHELIGQCASVPSNVDTGGGGGGGESLEAASGGTGEEGYQWKRKSTIRVKKGQGNAEAAEGSASPGHRCVDTGIPVSLQGGSPKRNTAIATNSLVPDASVLEQIESVEEAYKHASVCSGIEKEVCVDTQPLNEQPTSVPSEGILDRAPSEVPSVEKDNVEGKQDVMAPTRGNKEGTVVEAESERPTEKEEPHLQGGSTPHLSDAIHSAEAKTSTDVTHLAGSMEGGRCDQEQPEVSITSSDVGDIQPPKHEEEVLPTIEPTQQVITSPSTLDPQEHQMGDVEATASNELYDWRRKRSQRKKTKTGEEAVEKRHPPSQDVAPLHQEATVRDQTEIVPPTTTTEATPIAPIEATPTAPTGTTPTALTEVIPTTPTVATPTAPPIEATPTAPTGATPIAFTEATPTALTEATPKAPTEFITILPMSAHPTLILDTSHSKQMVPIEEANEHTSGLEHVDTQLLGEQQTTIPSEGILVRTPSEVPSVEKDNVEGKLDVMAPTGGDKEDGAIEAAVVMPSAPQGHKLVHLTHGRPKRSARAPSRGLHRTSGAHVDATSAIKNLLEEPHLLECSQDSHHTEAIPLVLPEVTSIAPGTFSLTAELHHMFTLPKWRRFTVPIDQHNQYMPVTSNEGNPYSTVTHTETTPIASVEANITTPPSQIHPSLVLTETAPTFSYKVAPSSKAAPLVSLTSELNHAFTLPKWRNAVGICTTEPADGKEVCTQPLDEQPISVPSESILDRAPSEVPSVEKDNVEGKLDVMAPMGGDKKGTSSNGAIEAAVVMPSIPQGHKLVHLTHGRPKRSARAPSRGIKNGLEEPYPLERSQDLHHTEATPIFQAETTPIVQAEATPIAPTFSLTAELHHMFTLPKWRRFTVPIDQHNQYMPVTSNEDNPYSTVTHTQTTPIAPAEVTPAASTEASIALPPSQIYPSLVLDAVHAETTPTTSYKVAPSSKAAPLVSLTSQLNHAFTLPKWRNAVGICTTEPADGKEASTQPLDEQPTSVPSEGILDKATSEVPSVEKDNVEGKLDVMAPTGGDKEGTVVEAESARPTEKEEPHLQGGSTPHLTEATHSAEAKTRTVVTYLDGSVGGRRCDQGQADGEIPPDIQPPKHEEEVLPTIEPTQQVITPPLDTLDPQEHQTGDLEAAVSNELCDWRRKRGKYVKKSGRKKTNAGEEAVEKHHSPPQDVSSLPHVPLHQDALITTAHTEATPTAHTEATPTARIEATPTAHTDAILIASAHFTSVLDTPLPVHIEQPIEEAYNQLAVCRGLEYIDTQPLNEQPTSVPSEDILNRAPSEVPSVEKDNVEGKLDVMAPTGGDKEGTVVEAESERPTEKEEPHLQGGSTPHLTDSIHSAEAKTSTDVTETLPDIQPPKHEEEVLPTIEPTQQVITPPSDTLDPQEHQTGELEAAASNQLRLKRGRGQRKKTNVGGVAFAPYLEQSNPPPVYFDSSLGSLALSIQNDDSSGPSLQADEDGTISEEPGAADSRAVEHIELNTTNFVATASDMLQHIDGEEKLGFMVQIEEKKDIFEAGRGNSNDNFNEITSWGNPQFESIPTPLTKPIPTHLTEATPTEATPTEATPTPLTETTAPLTEATPTPLTEATPTPPTEATSTPPTETTPTPLTEATPPTEATPTPPTEATSTPLTEATPTPPTEAIPLIEATPTPPTEATSTPLTEATPPTEATSTPLTEATPPIEAIPPTEATSTPLTEATPPTEATPTPPIEAIPLIEATPTPPTEATIEATYTALDESHTVNRTEELECNTPVISTNEGNTPVIINEGGIPVITTDIPTKDVDKPMQTVDGVHIAEIIYPSQAVTSTDVASLIGTVEGVRCGQGQPEVSTTSITSSTAEGTHPIMQEQCDSVDEVHVNKVSVDECAEKETLSLMKHTIVEEIDIMLPAIELNSGTAEEKEKSTNMINGYSGCMKDEGTGDKLKESHLQKKNAKSIDEIETTPNDITLSPSDHQLSTRVQVEAPNRHTPEKEVYVDTQRLNEQPISVLSEGILDRTPSEVPSVEKDNVEGMLDATVCEADRTEKEEPHLQRGSTPHLIEAIHSAEVKTSTDVAYLDGSMEGGRCDQEQPEVPNTSNIFNITSFNPTADLNTTVAIGEHPSEKIQMGRSGVALDKAENMHKTKERKPSDTEQCSGDVEEVKSQGAGDERQRLAEVNQVVNALTEPRLKTEGTPHLQEGTYLAETSADVTLQSTSEGQHTTVFDVQIDFSVGADVIVPRVEGGPEDLLRVVPTLHQPQVADLGAEKIHELPSVMDVHVNIPTREKVTSGDDDKIHHPMKETNSLDELGGLAKDTVMLSVEEKAAGSEAVRGGSSLKPVDHPDPTEHEGMGPEGDPTSLHSEEFNFRRGRVIRRKKDDRELPPQPRPRSGAIEKNIPPLHEATPQPRPRSGAIEKNISPPHEATPHPRPRSGAIEKNISPLHEATPHPRPRSGAIEKNISPLHEATPHPRPRSGAIENNVSPPHKPTSQLQPHAAALELSSEDIPVVPGSHATRTAGVAQSPSKPAAAEEEKTESGFLRRKGAVRNSSQRTKDHK